MSSWGGIAVGGRRPSEDRPTQSAILGLLAAALGIRRHENDKHLLLQNSLNIGVCVRSRGELLNDYHTIQVPKEKPKEKSTILSDREYRTDFFYQVALWQHSQESHYSLANVKEALEKPRFNLSLGRKSCPLGLPLCPTIVSGETLLPTFEKVFRDDNFSQKICRTKIQTTYYWESGSIDEEYLGIPEKELVLKNTRRNKIRNRTPWQFSNLTECCYTE